MSKNIRISVIALIVISIVIYLIQIAIFHDVRTTEFYLLQDLAFMPLTIAIATIVVGGVIDAREKKDRLEKTRMLTSSFFTEIGASLLQEMMRMTEANDFIYGVVSGAHSAEMDENQTIEQIKSMHICLHLDQPGYEQTRQIISSNKTNILILASNPLVIEHESFTDVLWGIFHLIDEFRLRGEWSDLTAQDKAHFEDDFAKVLRLLLLNWISDVHYLQETFPDFYAKVLLLSRSVQNRTMS